MSGIRWRANLILSVLAAIALCVGSQGTRLVSGKDKNNPAADKAKSAVKKKTRPEKLKKKKGSDENSNAGNQATNDGSSPSGIAVQSGGNSNNISGISGQNQQASTSSPNASTRSRTSGNTVGSGATRPQSSQPQPQGPNAGLVKKVMDVQNRNHAALAGQKGVVGTATGLDDDGNVVIRVYTTGADSPQIPKTIEGVPVLEVLTGPIYPAQTSPSAPYPRQRLTRPVPIGVSAFSDTAQSSTSCQSGTLGCRLTDANGNVYALSTNHNFAGENSLPLNTTPIVQPSPGDDSCQTGIAADQLGDLVAFIKVIADNMTTNEVDCAIISTTKKLVNSSTPGGGYGDPASITTTSINTASLGQKLQKYGRTTGYTQGLVTGVNVQLTVAYAGGQAIFINQFEVGGAGSFAVFGSFGDSGALAVDMNKNPIGLVFAADGTNIWCNPITTVLTQLSTEISSQLNTSGQGGSPGGGGQVVLPPGTPPTIIPPSPIVKEARSTPNTP